MWPFFGLFFKSSHWVVTFHLRGWSNCTFLSSTMLSQVSSLHSFFYQIKLGKTVTAFVMHDKLCSLFSYTLSTFPILQRVDLQCMFIQ